MNIIYIYTLRFPTVFSIAVETFYISTSHPVVFQLLYILIDSCDFSEACPH